jgi:D-glycero-D-manno-heptose 1,7-bisphosphate phosphatase
MPSMDEGTRGAVFLDRDGTLIEDPGYLHRPEDVRLVPGAGGAVARLNAAGWPVVVITNQSGIARGLYDVAAYRSVEQRLEELLAAAGARLDGTYYCPHHPDVTGPCDCRKPGVRLFREAARALGIDLRRSWYVGDKASDVEPARALGGRGILVATGAGAAHIAAARRLGADLAADVAAAADRVLAG